MFYTYFIIIIFWICPWYNKEHKTDTILSQRRNTQYYRSQHTDIENFTLAQEEHTQTPQWYNQPQRRTPSIIYYYLLSRNIRHSKSRANRAVQRRADGAIQLHFNLLYLFYIPRLFWIHPWDKKEHTIDTSLYQEETQYMALGEAAPHHRIHMARFARWARPRHTIESIWLASLAGRGRAAP